MAAHGRARNRPSPGPSSSREPAPERRRRWLLPAASSALLVLAAIAWRAAHDTPAPRSEAAAVSAARASAGSAPLETTPNSGSERAADGLPIMPAGSAPAPPGPHHPHPITPQHLRIYRENNLLAALNGAVDVRDAAGIRRLLAEYREEFPEDEHTVQAGYAVIADCLDQPSAAVRARAQRYYDEELASNIRRYVRRHCLE